MNRLTGKVALISGGARGIGGAAARRMAQEGAQVLIGDLLDAQGQALCEEIRAAGGKAGYMHLDVTSEADWAAAVRQANEQFGGLDVLVNNAGLFTGKDIETVSLDEWHRMAAVNMTGVILGVRAALPSLRERAQRTLDGTTSIINMSSVAGMRGSPLDPLYSMTKGAVLMFTKSIAGEFGHKGYRVRVNSVHPGVIDTDMGALTFAARAKTLGSDSEAAREQARKAYPIGRIGQADDVAMAIVYLASDDASFVTGSALVVDGGTTAC
ncbi:MAG: glucose 1-dehydrogenase [Burkholderiales bacterium]